MRPLLRRLIGLAYKIYPISNQEPSIEVSKRSHESTVQFLCSVPLECV